MNTISPSIPNLLAQLQLFINYLMNSMLGCVQKVEEAFIYVHLHISHTTIRYNHYVLLSVIFCIVLYCCQKIKTHTYRVWWLLWYMVHIGLLDQKL